MGRFAALTGITNETPDHVYDALYLDGTMLVSKITGWRADAGHLTVTSLADLRNATTRSGARTNITELVADARALHMEPRNAGAAFQVASQFNLLEMVGPSITPEMGVARYIHDRTQGPACALACLAGTIYRNYFVPLDGGIGQTHARQIDCLSGIAKLLNGDRRFLWDMRNGYALPTEHSLQDINEILMQIDADALRSALQIGIHKDTEVTLGTTTQRVTQIYCSAMPVAYSSLSPDLWGPLAKLILEAAYEATFSAAIQNAEHTGNNRLFLTMLGGGAFGNPQGWIADAIVRALNLHRDSGLDVSLVSYGQPSAVAQDIIVKYGP